MSKLENCVRVLLSQKLGVDESEVEMNSSLTDDLGADSLDLVEIALELEKSTGISINLSDEFLKEIRTVRDVVSYLEQEGITSFDVSDTSDGSDDDGHSFLESVEHHAPHVLFHIAKHFFGG